MGDSLDSIYLTFELLFKMDSIKLFFLQQESEELSSDEEMKMAEMRPPLIETSINQPKVVALSNSKKGKIPWKALEMFCDFDNFLTQSG